MALAFDGSAVTNSVAGGVGQTLSASISTSGADRIIIAQIEITDPTTGDPGTTLSGVADGSSLTWHRRSRIGQGYNGRGVSMEVWWAHAPTALASDSVTVTATGSTKPQMVLTLFAVSGANTTNPWDGAAALPFAMSGFSTGGSVERMPLSIHTTINTDSTLLIFFGSNDNLTGESLSSPWAKVGDVQNGSGDGASASAWYQAVTAVQNNAITDVSSFNGTNIIVIADALVPAGSTPITDVIGINSIGYAATHQGVTPWASYVSNQNAGDILVGYFGYDSGTASPTIGVTDSAGNTWTKLTTVEDTTSRNNSYLDIWYTVTTAANINNKVTMTPGTGTFAQQFMQIVSIANADTSSPFDSGSPFTANDTTGTTNQVVSGISSTVSNGLLLVGAWTDDSNAFVSWSGASSPALQNLGSTNINADNDWATNGVSLGVFSSMLSGYTTGNSDNTLRTWAAAAVVVKPAPPPAPNGPWASTEAADAMAFAGTIQNNTNAAWASVELTDIMAFSQFGGITASWASTETKDAMFFEGAGHWASTETKDAMAFVGSVTEPMLLDGYNTAAFSDSGLYTTADVALTTTQPNDVIVLLVSVAGFFNSATTVASVADTAGLTWKRRNQRWQLGGDAVDDDGNVIKGNNFEIWWAHAPAPLSGDTITATFNSAGVGTASLIAFAVSGANYTAPWDTHTLAGGYIDQIGGHFFPPAMQLYTNADEVFSFGFHGDSSPDNGGALAPATYVTQVTSNEHDGSQATASLFYEVLTEPAVNANNLQYTTSYAGGTVYSASSVMFDSIVALGEEGTTDPVNWFWDSTSNLGTLVIGSSPAQISYSANNYNCMALVQVLLQAAGGGSGAEVTSIVESGSGTPFANSPGFQRRSRVVEGNLAMEIWWAWMPATKGKPQGVTLTINTSGIVSGDVVTASVMNLGGTTGAFGLGDPFWDPNESLPAVNASTGDSPPPNTTGMSTETRTVLMVAWTANITEPEPGFVEPYFAYLQASPETIQPVMSFSSTAPPANLGFEFFYTDVLVSDETAEFLVSPEPVGWLMAGDAIPVGPPQPPIGQLQAVDQHDTFNNIGDWEPLDGTTGWFGFVPLQCTIAITDQPDQFTNDGDFEALGWVKGWAGYVPAFSSMAVTEHDDTIDLSGWVLGFGGITGQIVAAETVDRLSFSNAATVTGTFKPTETKDRLSSSGFVIPKARPVPVAPKRRLLIVT